MVGSQWLRSQGRHSYVATFVNYTSTSLIAMSPKGSFPGTPFLFVRGASQLLIEALQLHSLASNDPTYVTSPRRSHDSPQHIWLVLGLPLWPHEAWAVGSRASIVHFAKKRKPQLLPILWSWRSRTRNRNRLHVRTECR